MHYLKNIAARSQQVPGYNTQRSTADPRYHCHIKTPIICRSLIISAYSSNEINYIDIYKLDYLHTHTYNSNYVYQYLFLMVIETVMVYSISLHYN